MVRLVIPPVDARLSNTLDLPLKKGILNDDATWTNTVLPSLLERIDSVKAAVHQAQKTHASGPTAQDVDVIIERCDKIRHHLETQFYDGAPFTIYRIAELVLEPEKSGLSLSTVQQAQRYLAAFARTVLVSSKETDHLEKENGEPKQEHNGKAEKNDVPNKASPAQYEEYDLPRDVTFISLPWAQKSEKDDTPCNKRQKTENQLLSPLRESSKASRSPERPDSASPPPKSTESEVDS